MALLFTGLQVLQSRLLQPVQLVQLVCSLATASAANLNMGPEKTIDGSGLNDMDPYVKKTAIIGTVKYFHLTRDDPATSRDFSAHLYQLTRDHDPIVVINAIEAINEIEAD